LNNRAEEAENMAASGQHHLDVALKSQQGLENQLLSANRQLAEERKRAAIDLQATEERVAAIRAQREADQAKAAEMLEAAKQETATARDELNSVWNQIETLSSARNRIAEERDRLKAAHETAKQSQAKNAELSRELEAARRQQALTTQKSQELTEALEALQSDLAGMGELRKTEQSEILRLTSDFDDARRKQELAERGIADLSEEIRLLRGQIESLSGIPADPAKAEGGKRGLTRALSRFLGTAEELARRSELEGRVQELEAQLQTAQECGKGKGRSASRR
jgi:chromosome segregation ATPase